MTDRSSLSGGRFAMRLRLARAALLWERVWPACWPALAVLGVFLVLGLFDLLPNLPGLLHAAILLGLGAAFVDRLWLRHSGGSSFPIASPRAAASSRRAGLQHRPLQALADRPSGPLDRAGGAAVGRRIGGAWRRRRAGCGSAAGSRAGRA